LEGAQRFAEIKGHKRIMPILYVVATPIGNLKDITLRAIRILQSVDLVAAEDTRTTRKLLNEYCITTSVTSYNEQNKVGKLPWMLEQLRLGDVALVSDAGMPGLSDPGFELINAAHKEGFQVVPIPGPSAVVAALVVSGMPSDQFTYIGFLPRKAGERRRLLDSLKDEPRTVVAFESPHRLRETLEEMSAVMGGRRIAVCRELTKLHEEVFKGTVTEAFRYFQEPIGEFTLVIEGSRPSGIEAPDAAVRETLLRLRSNGISAKDAVGEVCRATGLPRNIVYREWLQLGSGGAHNGSS